ncbi:MAG TPA: bifunctional 4-hydroxy-2-oxoglutarate aldolase/2-dehydro-3-deoxy-phosphogluconate aldolase [Methylococcaceae bacterium]|jgi:2-dehydro-3-deoxyphosphogluconate aldolase/(4S)-4-hydroxy-2-oxoglutarate aldolase|nr:bifunctional 4-hydroxy-2-oxoglutarate aldolase/2-dehydro-3-deoxy-phosphogluconate aldolase [Methylococcaceae bacterium]
MNLDQIIAKTSVMPVMVVDRMEDAIPLAQALVEGGIRVLEITLRTAAGLDSVRAIRHAVPDAIVGVGTIATPGQLEASIAAGAQFGVSPGSTPKLLKAIAESQLPFLPGVATMSEVMQALEMGFNVMKLFPAVAAGGIKLLESFAGPFPQVRFCPTGGINAQNASDFFKLPNVACVGGSWLTPKNLVTAGNWTDITRLAREAAALKP